MSINVINEYIDFSKKNIQTYAQKIMGKYFDEEVFKELLEVFLSLRYYGYSPDYPDKDFKDLDECLKNKAFHIFDITLLTKEEVDNSYNTFKYAIYLDSLLQQEVQTYEYVDSFRQSRFGLVEEKFVNELEKLIDEKLTSRKKFIESFATEEFELLYRQTKINNLYDVTLTYHIDFPEIYSEVAIQKAFDKDLIKEQRLFVNYTLLSVHVLENILQGKYESNYLIDFDLSITKKKNKIKRLLNIIDNDIMKEKTSFKVSHEVYLEYKKQVLELIKNGYNFAIIIDDTYENLEENEIKMNLFKYIIIPEEKYYYPELQDNENVIIDY